MADSRAWLANASLPALILCSSGACSAAAASDYRDEINLLTDQLRPKLVEMRRDFYMHPELSNREERTARIVAERLRALRFDDVRTNVAHHGVVGLLKGSRPGAVVALRADMDALPIQDTLDVPYKSLLPGVKHACGHDAHTTIALGVAEVLSRLRDRFPGTVKFIFQPAEEGPPTGEEGGAQLMIKEGALENPKPAAIFGLHTTSELDAGVIGYRAGPAQASADGFLITVRGKGAHAASPEKGIDTVLVAAECVTALQSIKSRRIDTFEPIILTIGTIHGGSRPNIITDEVTLSGTVRAFSEAARQKVEQLMRQTLAGVTSAYGATYQMQYTPATTVVINAPKLVEATLPVIRNTIGPTNVVEVPKRMGAEDFSYYEQVVPGFFLRLGSGNSAKQFAPLAHTSQFDIDEDCLPVGVKVMANIAVDFLLQHAGAASSGAAKFGQAALIH